MHSWFIKEAVHFNLINKANMCNVTTVIVNRIFYIYKYYFTLMRKLLFFYTKFRNTWFCIIYLKPDLLMKTLRKGLNLYLQMMNLP